jgi:hypothetical protein
MNQYGRVILTHTPRSVILTHTPRSVILTRFWVRISVVGSPPK